MEGATPTFLVRVARENLFEEHVECMAVFEANCINVIYLKRSKN